MCLVIKTLHLDLTVGNKRVFRQISLIAELQLRPQAKRVRQLQIRIAGMQTAVLKLGTRLRQKCVNSPLLLYLHAKRDRPNDHAHGIRIGLIASGNDRVEQHVFLSGKNRRELGKCRGKEGGGRASGPVTKRGKALFVQRKVSREPRLARRVLPAVMLRLAVRLTVV